MADISPRQSVLGYLQEFGPVTQAELRMVLGVCSATYYAVIRELKREGLISVQRTGAGMVSLLPANAPAETPNG